MANKANTPNFEQVQIDRNFFNVTPETPFVGFLKEKTELHNGDPILIGQEMNSEEEIFIGGSAIISFFDSAKYSEGQLCKIEFKEEIQTKSKRTMKTFNFFVEQ